MKIPNEDHFAIITEDSVYVPGDDRSKTSPGHGYPEHYVETIHYEVFENFTEFEAKIIQLQRFGRAFKAISAKLVTIISTVKVLL